MKVDVQATKRVWRQTVWATGIAMIVVAGLTIYFWTQPSPDHASVRFSLVLLVLMPIALGVAYLIRRFIEGLAN